MCSDPQKRTYGGIEYTFACRRCDDCVATRIHEWVGRAMMEKATYGGKALVFAFTYSDNTVHGQIASNMFNYDDVRSMFHRIRAAVREIDPTDHVRFLCAGEQGSRYGRVHWHIVVYSKTDLLKIGKFEGLVNGKREQVTDRAKMISVGKRKIRLNWSIWPWGFVTVQEPNQGGMRYALSYALKDQFTVESSKGTAREAKAEDFATGMFRKSSRPPIGSVWIYEKLARLDQLGMVMPSMNFRVPDLSGYYHPSGSFRDLVLDAFHAIGWRSYVQTGRYPPQWSSLLEAVSIEEREYLEEIFKEHTDGDAFSEDPPSYREFIESDECIERVKRIKITRIREKCGADIPCQDCLNKCSPQEIGQLGLVQTSQGFARQSAPDRALKRYQKKHCNKFCGRKENVSRRQAFGLTPYQERKIRPQSGD